MASEFTIIAPDDFHHHFRDGPALPATVTAAAKQFSRCIVMPNLVPPVVTAEDATAYRQRLLEAMPKDCSFEPLMTLYLTDKTTPEMITAAWETGFVKAVKLYPAGATTNSDYGITNYESCIPALKRMSELGMVLCVHGESTDQSTDVFDREGEFYRDIMGAKIIDKVPGLKVVCEHITTKEAARFVASAPPTVAATITAHHLLSNRNAIFKGGIRPHMYCLPILKREEDRQELLKMATSGSPKFFLGTDSAPHAVEKKECCCGCAGIFTAHAALPLYAEAFDSIGKLDMLEGFASKHGADFYGLPYNTQRMVIRRKEWTVPDTYPFRESTVVPYRAGEKVNFEAVKC